MKITRTHDLSTLTLLAAARVPWDAVVIGAGPAGSMAARELARQDVRVLMVERAKFPRDKVCGCCLNGAALEILRSVGLGCLVETCGGRAMQQLRLISGQRLADVPLHGGMSISRGRLDAELVSAAIASGVDVLMGTRATVGPSLEQSRCVELHAAGECVNVSTRTIIVATGLGVRIVDDGDERDTTSASRLGAGVVLDGAPVELVAGIVYMTVHPCGYIGLVRLEDDRVDVAAALDGTAVKRAGGIGPLVEGILNQTAGPCLPGIGTAAWHGTAKLTQQRRQLFGERYFVVGDAAGYVEPFTGEGIAWALATGRAVVPFALDSLNRGTELTGPLWTKQYKALLGARMRRCRMVSRLLRHPRLMHVAVQVLSRIPWVARPLVNSLNASYVKDLR